MRCEMCGKEAEAVGPVRIEGSVLQLCGPCSRFGQPIAPPPGSRPLGGAGPAASVRTGAVLPASRRGEERDLFAELPELELAADWNQRIRSARERLGWTPEEFGKRLNEKKSLVLKVEAGAFRPSDATVRKIERLLKVRLAAAPGSDPPSP